VRKEVCGSTIFGDEMIPIPDEEFLGQRDRIMIGFLEARKYQRQGPGLSNMYYWYIGAMTMLLVWCISLPD
jgi:hypothetical protein